MVLAGCAADESSSAKPLVGWKEAERFDYCESPDLNADLVARSEAAVEKRDAYLRALMASKARLAREGAALARSLPDPAACRNGFSEGMQLYWETLGPISVTVRRSMAKSVSDDQTIKGVQQDLGQQWHFDETIRRVLEALPAESEGPSARWANALANDRMRRVAEGSAYLVSMFDEQFGGVDVRRFGYTTAQQAEELKQRYGRMH
ncbi:hypothetical protein [Arenimonas donghaensis]|nr:hypothetical protein [Arenimonas donghaensis]